VSEAVPNGPGSFTKKSSGDFRCVFDLFFLSFFVHYVFLVYRLMKWDSCWLDAFYTETYLACVGLIFDYFNCALVTILTRIWFGLEASIIKWQ